MWPALATIRSMNDDSPICAICFMCSRKHCSALIAFVYRWLQEWTRPDKLEINVAITNRRRDCSTIDTTLNQICGLYIYLARIWIMEWECNNDDDVNKYIGNQIRTVIARKSLATESNLFVFDLSCGMLNDGWGSFISLPFFVRQVHRLCRCRA